MNEIQFLTDNEFENLKANIDLTTEEETLLSFIRNNTMTAYGIAAEMQISEHRYKAVKNMAIVYTHKNKNAITKIVSLSVSLF